MTVCMNTFARIVRNEIPTLSFLFFQWEISFLKASISKTVWRMDTKKVVARRYMLVSTSTRFISSNSAPEEPPPMPGLDALCLNASSRVA